MNDLMVFSNDVFGTVRTEVIDGKVYFAGLDIARALGYKKPRNAVCRHCHEALKRGATDSRGRRAQISFISEGDVYRLVTGSTLPTAQAFESWIFDEVLPQIRQTGGYIPVTSEDDEKMVLAKAMEIMQKTLEHKDKVIVTQEKTIKELKEQIVLDDKMVASIHKRLKIKVCDIYGVKYWKNNPEYKVLKNRVLSFFRVEKWSDIPAGKYEDVLRFIEKMH